MLKKIKYTDYIDPDWIYKFVVENFTNFMANEYTPDNILLDPGHPSKSFDLSSAQSLSPAKFEKEMDNWLHFLMDTFLGLWTNDANDRSRRFFYKLQPVLDELKSQGAFTTDIKSKYMYRGTSASDKLKEFLKSTSALDFSAASNNYMLYTKEQITYTPKSTPQSWTTDIAIAADFSSGILFGAKVDIDHTYFSSEDFSSVYDRDEKEIIVTKDKYKGFLLISRPAFNLYVLQNERNTPDQEKLEPMFSRIN